MLIRKRAAPGRKCTGAAVSASRQVRPRRSVFTESVTRVEPSE